MQTSSAGEVFCSAQQCLCKVYLNIPTLQIRACLSSITGFRPAALEVIQHNAFNCLSSERIGDIVSISPIKMSNNSFHIFTQCLGFYQVCTFGQGFAMGWLSWSQGDQRVDVC